MRRMLISIILFSLASLTFAETCPSADAVRTASLIGWKAYDSEDNTPLTTARNEQFKKNVQRFTLAEWKINVENKDKSKDKKGAVRCYYSDKNGSDLEAYLSRDGFTLAQQKSFWYEVSGSMHCAAGNSECAFQYKIPYQTQLAKK